MMQLDPPTPLTGGSRSRNSSRRPKTPPPEEQRSCHAWIAGISATVAVTRCLGRIWLQDCRNEERDLTKLADSPAGLLLPQQRKPYRIQDDVKVLEFVDERHATLLQGVVHHRVASRTGKEDHAVL